MCSIKDGSFFFPLFGTGAKKGLSVSIKTFSSGRNLNVSCNSSEFLNVIIPLAEKKAFKLSYFSANCFEPVKQCIRILRFLSLCSFKILIVSSSAFLE